MKLWGSRILTTALYMLPVLFFVMVYFLQVTSSEDIFQGAGQPVSIVNDMLAAFHWSARLGDMYAWSVINFFDYTYQFGPDTIFRLIDVILAVTIFYVMTVIILGRRPKWDVRDGLVFTTSFLVIFLSEYSRSLISSFSHVHNYLFITLFSLLFLLPFVWQLRGKVVANSARNKIIMLLVGFLFGFSSNILPVAFLVTAVLVIVYERVVTKRTISIARFVRSWHFFALIGILLAMVVMYGIGPGLSSYTHGYNPSYVSIQNLLSTPLQSGTALLGNIVHNFQLVTPILVTLGLIALFEYVIARKRLLTKRQEVVPGIRFSLICLVFFVVTVLGVSQIDVSGTTRLLISAYVCAVVCILFTINRILEIVEVPKRVLLLVAISVLLICGTITADITIGITQHKRQATLVLERIKAVPTNDACVTPADNPTAKSPLLKYYQRELFTDWMMPTTIYGKVVNWC